MTITIMTNDNHDAEHDNDTDRTDHCNNDDTTLSHTLHYVIQQYRALSYHNILPHIVIYYPILHYITIDYRIHSYIYIVRVTLG